MSAHTPGPWKYGVRKDGSIWLSIGDPMTGPHYQGDLVATEADARLIIVARELLEALEFYLCQDEIAEGFGGGVGGEAKEKARAAIAKATGEQA